MTTGEMIRSFYEAFGPGAEAFAGVHENAEIGQIVKKLMK